MTLLELYKSTLGITHTALDERLSVELTAAENELNRKGANIDLTNTDDMLLTVDTAVWFHNHWQNGEGLPNNIVYRIRDRQIRARSEQGE